MGIGTASGTTRAAMRRLLDDPIFEVIPLSNALEQVGHLAPGSRISVTASPNKTLDESLDLCARLVGQGFRVTPHLSARMVEDTRHLEHLLHRIADLELRTAFVVGGDAPFTGQFFDGLSLLQAMEEIGHDLEIGVPSYPEGHPDIPADTLARALSDKEGHASWTTTQMCFDGDLLNDWLTGARAGGLRLPAVLGLPAAADRARLLNISRKIGVGRSMSFLRKNTGLVSAFVKPGGYDPSDLLLQLGERLDDPTLDISGLHLYTFNQCDTTEDWRRRVLSEL